MLHNSIAFANAIVLNDPRSVVVLKSSTRPTARKRSTWLRMPSRPLPLSRNVRQITASASVPSSTGSKSERYFPASSPAEQIFQSYCHPIPRGAADLARSRGVPVDDISACYGHMLAATAVEDIPSIARDHTVMLQSLRTSLNDTLTPESDDPRKTVNLSALSALMSRACDPTQVENFSNGDASRMSELYAQMLATSARISGMEFDPDSLCSAFAARLDDATAVFPMESRQVFEEGFAAMKNAAATAAGSSALDAADIFFRTLRNQNNDCLRDVDGDGYILAMDHVASTTESSGATSSLDEVGSGLVAVRARLFDGRCIMSALPDSAETADDTASDQGLILKIADVPLALAKAVGPLKEDERTTIFFHPYAAHEVLPLFISLEQTPPQAALILDVCLVKLK